LWFRAGPVRLSSRGRVGVGAGPFSFYAGGRSRRRGQYAGCWAVVLGLILVGAVLVELARYWYYSVPALFALLFVWGKLAARSKRKREAKYRAWLTAPPPPLVFPGRFTPNWFRTNGARLHPGHIAPLLVELRRRGWSEDDIAQRAEPYLPAFPDKDLIT